MKELPTEILSTIFRYSTQRIRFSTISLVCKRWYAVIYHPLYFSTIEIQSEKQLQSFMELAKNKTVQHEPISIYVTHIKMDGIIHLTVEELQVLLSTFPNIESINGLFKKIDPNLDLGSYSLPAPQTLTHFSFWITERDIKWINNLFNHHNDNNERVIKSIEFEINDKMIYIHPSHTSILPPIHCKFIGQPKQFPSYLNYHLSTTKFFTLLLSLPNLIHLTNLQIELDSEAFGNSLFEECTFENIHNSCPQLESLTVKYFYFSLSDTTIMNNNNNNNLFKPANHLKMLDIDLVILDARCYSYILLKYPQLETLRLRIEAIPILKCYSELYKMAIYNMLDQLYFLKRMDIYVGNAFTLVRNINRMNEEYLPNDEFIQWLLQHPKQITDFTYCNRMIKKSNYSTERSTTNETTEMDAYENVIYKIVLQKEFIIHLTYLSMASDYLTDIIYYYLLQNNQSKIVSSSIKELVINNTASGNCISFVYIHDFLDVLSNLISLTIKCCVVINDDNDLISYTKHNHMQYNSNTNALHKLINQRKQENEVPLCKDNGNIYDLKCLSFFDCIIYITNGLNDIFKTLPHLNTLKFCMTKYSRVGLNLKIVDDFIDLSHLSLIMLHIFNLQYIPWSTGSSSKDDKRIVTKITVNETSIHKKSIITKYIEATSLVQSLYHQTHLWHYYPINLHLTCKYIDKIVFKSTVYYQF
ncbi:unnamed protein product [Cunninghamella blakesleeana]